MFLKCPHNSYNCPFCGVYNEEKFCGLTGEKVKEIKTCPKSLGKKARRALVISR